MQHADGPAEPRPPRAEERALADGVRAAVAEALDRVAARAPESEALAELVAALRPHLEGGKLVRPRLVELGWRAAGGLLSPGDRAAVERLGAAFELLHTALLVHDDVIDRDTLRRGRPTVVEEHRARLTDRGVPAAEAAHGGVSVAVVAGDLLLVEALRLASTSVPDAARAVPVAAVVFDAATATAAGELEDVLLGLDRHVGEEPDLERILAMQRLKTAAYTFAGPLRAGALLGGAGPELAEALARLGADLGVAYQAVDDVLGVFGAPETTGKPDDGDLREGKATVVTAHGRRDPAVRALLDRAVRGSEADVAAARQALLSAGAREHALALAARLVDGARARLDGLPLAPDVRADVDAACRAILDRRA